jgi:hypothetical protein
MSYTLAMLNCIRNARNLVAEAGCFFVSSFNIVKVIDDFCSQISILGERLNSVGF